MNPKQDSTDLLRTENTALRELIRRSSIGYHSIDDSGIILDINQVWLDTLGYSQDEVVGRWFGDFIHETYLEKFKAGFSRLKEKGIIENFTFVLKHKDGSPVELVFNGTVERDENRRFIRSHSAFHRPESARMSAENRIYMNLEEKILSKSRLELMGDMLCAVAHQWRQPLNALALLVQDTQEMADLAGIGTGEIKDNTVLSMELIMKMSSTIDDFRSFFSNRHDEEHIQITDLLMECISLVFSQLQQSGIDFSVICECEKDYFSCRNELTRPDCKQTGRYVLCSRMEMKQIILNIISNARSAIISSIEKGLKNRGEMEFHVKFLNDSVVLSVRNNGEQIKDDVLSRMFEPYFTTRDEGEGIGLGLFVSKTIIEKYMKGSIDILNTDAGVIVRIVLPVHNMETQTDNIITNS
ncbi:sensor histidine kinase [Seleniivibrio woodruffii]|uniref:sensor histidine kinase n=1 Tax=Seleniivibrio woodruffii TaxID=1078050 RepID=UPI0039E4282A